MNDRVLEEHYPRGWHYDPSSPSWRTEQSVLAFVALLTAAWPAEAGFWALLYAAGFLATLWGRESRWLNQPAAVYANGAFAFLCFAFSAVLTVSEAWWYGAWPISLLFLSGVTLAWLGPAVAECLASWQFYQNRRRSSPVWKDLFHEEEDHVA